MDEMDKKISTNPDDDKFEQNVGTGTTMTSSPQPVDTFPPPMAAAAAAAAVTTTTTIDSTLTTNIPATEDGKNTSIADTTKTTDTDTDIPTDTDTAVDTTMISKGDLTTNATTMTTNYEPSAGEKLFYGNDSKWKSTTNDGSSSNITNNSNNHHRGIKRSLGDFQHNEYFGEDENDPTTSLPLPFGIQVTWRDDNDNNNNNNTKNDNDNNKSPTTSSKISATCTTALVTIENVDTTFCMIGRANVKCIKGSVEILGYVLTSNDNDGDDNNDHDIDIDASNHHHPHTTTTISSSRSEVVTVKSPFWTSWIPFRSLSPSTQIQFTSILSSSSSSSWENNNNSGNNNNNKNNSNGRKNPTFRLAPPTRTIVIPSSWKTTADQIVYEFTNAKKPPSSSFMPIRDSLEDDAPYYYHHHHHVKQQVLICGAKGVGKSTMLRYLVNRLLSANKNSGSTSTNTTDMETIQLEQVAILDADVGQPELSPPGVLRLSLQKGPLLQTPYWNLTKPIPTIASVFFGAVTSKVDPTRYIEGIQRLIQAYHDYISTQSTAISSSLSSSPPPPIPLIINMDGWIKGLGYQILTAIINHIQPTHICQILGESRGQIFELDQHPAAGATAANADEEEQKRTLFFLDACTKHGISSPCIIPSSTLRTIRLGTYFAPSLLPLWYAIDTTDAKLLQSNNNGWMNDIDEECMLAQYLASERPYCVPFEAVTYSWCNVDIQEELVSSSSSEGEKEDCILQAMNGNIVGLVTDNDDCLGLGIVRSIDWYQRLFYILTPVEESILPSVTKLIGGNLSLPLPFLFRGVLAESFPYITTTTTTTTTISNQDSTTTNTNGTTGDSVVALGTEPMKSRNSIARRGLLGNSQQPQHTTTT